MNQKNVERELLQQEYDNNKFQLEQLKHQQERLENRITYYEKGERKKRTHRLCTIAGTMESIAPGMQNWNSSTMPTMQHSRISVKKPRCFGESNPTSILL